MNSNRPAPIFYLFCGETHIFKVMLVEEFGRTVLMRRPYQRRNCVDDQVKTVFVPRSASFRRLISCKAFLSAALVFTLFGDVRDSPYEFKVPRRRR